MESNSFDMKIGSLNIRGLNEVKKRRVVFDWINKQKMDIMFLQETHSSVAQERYWRGEWGGELYFSHGATNSRGVAILVSKKSTVNVDDYHCSSDGRLVIVKVKQNDKFMYLVNIYVPNVEKAQIQFFKQIKREMENFGITGDDCTVIGGDFNVTLAKIDKQGGTTQLKTGAIAEIHRMMTTFDLQDVWRIHHPEKKQFTWRQRHPTVHCRLDYFLMSNRLQESVKKVEILPTVQTDHSAVMLHLEEIPVQQHGKGHWKFNSTLIEDPEYTHVLKTKIEDWKQEVCCIDARGRWEYVKFKVREFTISYSKLKAKEKRVREQTLERRLIDLETTTISKNITT